MDGETLYTGGRPMKATSIVGQPPAELAIAEQLDVVRDMILSYQRFEAQLEAAIKPGPGEPGYQIDID
jgi:hypothetical protein